MTRDSHVTVECNCIEEQSAKCGSPADGFLAQYMPSLAILTNLFRLLRYVRRYYVKVN